MIDETTPDPENAAAAQPPAVNAYDRAGAPHLLAGKPLHPFAARRVLAAQAIGNRLLSGRAALELGGCYDGMFADVVTVMFLCSHGPAPSLRALRDPAAVLGEALDWAEKIGLEVGLPLFEEACGVYGAMMKELSDAQFKVTRTANGGNTNSGNSAGGSPTAL